MFSVYMLDSLRYNLHLVISGYEMKEKCLIKYIYPFQNIEKLQTT